MHRVNIVGYTVFPQIVSAETVLFWRWKMWKFSYSFPQYGNFLLHELNTCRGRGDTIWKRQLFNWGNYSRKYGKCVCRKYLLLEPRKWKKVGSKSFEFTSAPMPRGRPEKGVFFPYLSWYMAIDLAVTQIYGVGNLIKRSLKKEGSSA